MDPEPEQNPMESTSPVPQPMMMDRSLSSESGSNSSLSTVHVTKGSKSGSAASSRSGSVVSTSRSAHADEGVPSGSLSPSFGQGQGQGEGHKDGDQPPGLEEEKKNESTVTTKEDSVHAFEQAKGRTTTVEALKKGSDQIVSEVARTEAVILKEAEQTAEDCCSCCKCCRSSATWGVAGDVAAILCCPFTVISLLSCMCFRCPKLFAAKTAEKMKSIKSRTKGPEQPLANKEGAGFEELKETAGDHGSQKTSVKHVHSAGHEEKPEVPAETKLKNGKSHSEKLKSSTGYFLTPDVEDDHPGGDR